MTTNKFRTIREGVTIHLTENGVSLLCGALPVVLTQTHEQVATCAECRATASYRIRLAEAAREVEIIECKIDRAKDADLDALYTQRDAAMKKFHSILHTSEGN